MEKWREEGWWLEGRGRREGGLTEKGERKGGRWVRGWKEGTFGIVHLGGYKVEGGTSSHVPCVQVMHWLGSRSALSQTPSSGTTKYTMGSTEASTW